MLEPRGRLRERRQDVVRQPPHRGQVLREVAAPGPRGVFAVAHVEGPVQPVLDVPVPWPASRAPSSLATRTARRTWVRAAGVHGDDRTAQVDHVEHLSYAGVFGVGLSRRVAAEPEPRVDAQGADGREGLLTALDEGDVGTRALRGGGPVRSTTPRRSRAAPIPGPRHDRIPSQEARRSGRRHAGLNSRHGCGHGDEQDGGQRVGRTTANAGVLEVGNDGGEVGDEVVEVSEVLRAEAARRQLRSCRCSVSPLNLAQTRVAIERNPFRGYRYLGRAIA